MKKALFWLYYVVLVILPFLLEAAFGAVNKLRDTSFNAAYLFISAVLFFLVALFLLAGRRLTPSAAPVARLVCAAVLVLYYILPAVLPVVFSIPLPWVWACEETWLLGGVVAAFCLYDMAGVIVTLRKKKKELS